MFSRIFEYFIPTHAFTNPEVQRKYRLASAIMLITALFDLNYVGLTVLIGMTEGTYVMLVTFVLHALLPILLKRGFPFLVIVNAYVLFGVQAVVQCIYYSGGFESPVLPWLATSPIVALLMGGRRTGITWAVINTLIVVVFSELSKGGVEFPVTYDAEWRNLFFTNCFTGLVLIIFIVSLVFEDGKNTALKKLAENNELLAEERKRNALYKISQEIHDGVGQTLSLVKLNLHSMQTTGMHEPNRIQNSLLLVSKAISDLRNISRNLSETNINDFDLREALTSDVKTLDKIGQHKMNLEVQGKNHSLTVETQFVIYRIIQELTQNTIKHADATCINIKLDYLEKFFVLTFADNGIGLENANLSEGLGFTNIRSRVKALSGELNIKSAKNEGTEITITIPLIPAESNRRKVKSDY